MCKKLISYASGYLHLPPEAVSKSSINASVFLRAFTFSSTEILTITPPFPH